MIRDILIWPDPVLSKPSVAVTAEDVKAGKYDQLVLDCFDTMFEAGGIGLAAVQIGEPVRLFVMDVHAKDYAFFNPIVVEKKGLCEPHNEGCLSLPGIVERILRHEKATVTALDRNGEPVTLEFTGIEAQCVQHEAEHLDGVLIPDKLSSLTRGRLRDKMLKLKKEKSK